MKYLIYVVIGIAISAVVSYFDSNYEKLSPPGKFNKSFKKNFIRNLVTFGAIAVFVSLINNL